ncbi:hypothetical protein HZY91_00090 [Facklamia sp. DSM 111018]|uniref:Uncharacterized protein n=1 Tax=Facklamia lactis TaxID=2749967 RepID=A0ABS0LMA6_9LACT|nr:hypothetical protein [Facklamia lactis]MBG9980034.1 hypothetical protein [Facklamia lactis]MBG9985286.1 hypothetical protein [Facklamia lactis]
MGLFEIIAIVFFGLALTGNKKKKNDKKETGWSQMELSPQESSEKASQRRLANYKRPEDRLKQKRSSKADVLEKYYAKIPVEYHSILKKYQKQLEHMPMNLLRQVLDGMASGQMTIQKKAQDFEKYPQVRKMLIKIAKEVNSVTDRNQMGGSNEIFNEESHDEELTNEEKEDSERIGAIPDSIKKTDISVMEKSSKKEKTKMSKSQIRQAIIWSEILQAPKSLR